MALHAAVDVSGVHGVDPSRDSGGRGRLVLRRQRGRSDCIACGLEPTSRGQVDRLVAPALTGSEAPASTTITTAAAATAATMAFERFRRAAGTRASESSTTGGSVWTGRGAAIGAVRRGRHALDDGRVAIERLIEHVPEGLAVRRDRQEAQAPSR